ncbi:MAG: zinc ribbon domain-containing protein [Acidobacteria bacterium]|nr:zinc ribbon domain-containing protein [Acidobacteriota bacterium]
MPLYEYKCRLCGKHFDKLQKFADAPLTTCELCGQPDAVDRLISTPAFHLKGSGWYKDGYSGAKKGGGASAGGSDSSSSSESKSSGDSSSSSSSSSDTKSSSTSSSDSKPAAPAASPAK